LKRQVKAAEGQAAHERAIAEKLKQDAKAMEERAEAETQQLKKELKMAEERVAAERAMSEKLKRDIQDAEDRAAQERDAKKAQWGTTAADPKSKASTSAKDSSLPISAMQVIEVLGPPKTSDAELGNVNYEGLDICGMSIDVMELYVSNQRGRQLALKLFASKLFTKSEGKALSLLLQAEGVRKIGRFEITSKQSIVVAGMVILKITPVPSQIERPDDKSMSFDVHLLGRTGPNS
jgi:hypothetical protein